MPRRKKSSPIPDQNDPTQIGWYKPEWLSRTSPRAQEILSDAALVEGIKRGLQQLADGRSKSLAEVKRLTRERPANH